MPLGPQAQKLLDQSAALPPLYTLSPADARKRTREAALREPPGPAVAHVREIDAGGVPSRLYHPSPMETLPVFVYFHGGGWVFNDLDTHDGVCRTIAHHSGCVVISVGYRLAPEHKYPAARDDAYTATVWVHDNAASLGIDPSRIAVGGDSAGGTLATTVAMMSRDRGGPKILFQVLAYPITDYHTPPPPSYDEHANGYSLNREGMMWFWNLYLPEGTNLNDPYLCPLRATNLRHLPPALILTAEYDPLRDEGMRYALRLKDAGLEVVHRHYADQMHGFVRQFQSIDQGRAALIEISRRLRERLVIKV